MSGIDKADLLRAAANKAKNRSNGRVSNDTRLSIVGDFLNSDNEFTTVENVYRVTNPTKPLSAIVASFRTTIKDAGLDELCYPVEMDGHAYLTKLGPIDES